MIGLTSARRLTLCAIAMLSLAGSFAFADTFTVSYLAAGVQAPATGSYETFDAFSPGSYSSLSTSVGQITGSFSIDAATAFGGAGGTGNYLAVANGSAATLTISGGTSTIGLWISALDGGNVLTFYNGATQVFSFDPAQLIAALGACPGTGYCGNPNDGYEDNPQQFAYANFVDDTGSFTSVVISQDLADADFEVDNITLASQGPNGGTPVNPTPEPSSLVLLGTGITSLVSLIRRRRR